MSMKVGIFLVYFKEVSDKINIYICKKWVLNKFVIVCIAFSGGGVINLVE